MNRPPSLPPSLYRLLRFVSRRVEARTNHERSTIERGIEHADRRVDVLVYELYGLTDEEIAIVEEATRR